MANVQEVFEQVEEIAEEINTAVSIHVTNGSRGVTVGDSSWTQMIEVEFDGPVPKKYKTRFLELGNRTDWEFVDEDNVFEGENRGHGLISISREVDADEIELHGFEPDKYF